MGVLMLQGELEGDSYSDNSICVNAARILSSHSCGSYISEAVQPLCLETYSTNNSDLHVVYLEGQNVHFSLKVIIQYDSNCHLGFYG